MLNIAAAIRQKKYRSSKKGKATRSRWDKKKAQQPARQEYMRQYNARRSIETYGITPGQYEVILTAQGGGCAICGSKSPRGVGKRLHIDHCHSSAKVRGLLCGPCNLALGLFQESADLLDRARRYLGGP